MAETKFVIIQVNLHLFQMCKYKHYNTHTNNSNIQLEENALCSLQILNVFVSAGLLFTLLRKIMTKYIFLMFVVGRDDGEMALSRYTNSDKHGLSLTDIQFTKWKVRQMLS